MSFIRILLITFVLLLAAVLGLKEDGRRWLKFTQLSTALQIQLAEDQAGKPINQR